MKGRGKITSYNKYYILHSGGIIMCENNEEYYAKIRATALAGVLAMHIRAGELHRDLKRMINIRKWREERNQKIKEKMERYMGE